MSRRVSAIDIGSNAIRMMIAEISENFEGLPLRVIKRFRAPLRLGHDVFTQGVITPHTMDIAIDTFHQFVKSNQQWGVTECRAVATSASREAKNRDEFVSAIYKASGIKIQIIDGTEEGRLIHLAVQKELDLKGKKTMLIDIGGGSIEISFSEGMKMVSTKSFPMGTVRILENLSKRKLTEAHLNIIMGEFIADISEHVHKNCDLAPVDFAVGTGGNLECLGQLKVSLLKKTPNSFVTLPELTQIIDKLKATPLRERVTKLQLRPDRADVILPAAMLIETILRQAEVSKIVIPSVGLRDGLIWSMI